jgi:cation transport protein ChaC
MPQNPAAKTRLPGAMQLTLDLVAKTMKVMEDEGPEPNWTPISSQQLDELVTRVEEEADGEEIWVFATTSSERAALRRSGRPGLRPSAAGPRR